MAGWLGGWLVEQLSGGMAGWVRGGWAAVLVQLSLRNRLAVDGTCSFAGCKRPTIKTSLNGNTSQMFYISRVRALATDELRNRS